MGGCGWSIPPRPVWTRHLALYDRFASIRHRLGATSIWPISDTSGGPVGPCHPHASQAAAFCLWLVCSRTARRDGPLSQGGFKLSLARAVTLSLLTFAKIRRRELQKRVHTRSATDARMMRFGPILGIAIFWPMEEGSAGRVMDSKRRRPTCLLCLAIVAVTSSTRVRSSVFTICPITGLTNFITKSSLCTRASG